MRVSLASKRYASAFFQHIKENNSSSAESIWAEMSQLAVLAKDSKEFSNIISNPTISSEEKHAVFRSLNESKKISNELYNFIQVLIDKKRLNLFVEIEASIRELILLDENKLEAEAVFAAKADESVKKEITAKLEKLTGKKIILKDVVDPSIIGGVKIKLGSQLFDATIKGQLDRIKLQLS